MDFEDLFFEFEDYELTNQRIAEGSFSVIYIAEKLEDGSQYAAKILKGELQRGTLQKMILRESTIQHKIDHPAVLKLIGLNLVSFENQTQFGPTFLMELCKKGTVKSMMDKDRKSIADSNWSPTKKYICLLGVAHAMKYLHKNGIIHRDLKTENILLDDNYYPKIYDF